MFLSKSLIERVDQLIQQLSLDRVSLSFIPELGDIVDKGREHFPLQVADLLTELNILEIGSVALDDQIYQLYTPDVFILEHHCLWIQDTLAVDFRQLETVTLLDQLLHFVQRRVDQLYVGQLYVCGLDNQVLEILVLQSVTALNEGEFYL